MEYTKEFPFSGYDVTYSYESTLDLATIVGKQKFRFDSKDIFNYMLAECCKTPDDVMKDGLHINDIEGRREKKIFQSLSFKK